MLYYTSLLFITNVIHASMVCYRTCEYLTLFLTASSILHHGKYYDSYPGKGLVLNTDRTIVASIYLMGLHRLYAIYNLIGINYIYNMSLLSLLFTSVTGGASIFFEDTLTRMNIRWQNVHAIFHVSACISIHLVLANYRLAYPEKCYQICPSIAMY
jgi:hypothetical protein